MRSRTRAQRSSGGRSNPDPVGSCVHPDVVGQTRWIVEPRSRKASHTTKDSIFARFSRAIALAHEEHGSPCSVVRHRDGLAADSQSVPGYPRISDPESAAPVGVLTRLPGDDNRLALIIDDGASVQVVGVFADFCRDSGIRLRFFVNGANSSWSVNAPALRPMVDSGQIQMGNHTWSHPDITRIGSAAVAEKIRRNADFLRNTYGVDGTPYFRPPYGAPHSHHRPDSGRSRLCHHYVVELQPHQIGLGHANLPTVTHCFPSCSTSSRAATCKP